MSNLQLLTIFCILCGLISDSSARRFARRLGGGYLEPIDRDDPEVVTAAKFAANKLKGTLIKVTSAHEQVVAGWMYHLTIHIKSQQHKDMRCRVKVWVRHWLNRIVLVASSCKPIHA